MKKISLIVLFGLFSILKAYSNVTLTAPTKNNYCLNVAANVGTITIDENANNDFQVGSNYIFLSAPAGFEFVTTSGNLAESGADVNAIGWLFRTPGVFGISYGVVATADDNVLTISNIQLIATSLGSGIIRFETGSTNIQGLTVGTTAFANVSTGITAINFNSVTPKCSNDAQFALAGSHTLSPSTTLVSAPYSSTPNAGAITGGTNFSPSATGNNSQTVTYTVNTSGGCSFTKSISIEINAAPNVTLYAEESTGTTNNDDIICTGDAIKFSANGANSYQFKVNNVNGTGASNATPWTISGLVNGDDITVVGTSTNGCSATSGAKNITVNALPGAASFTPSVTSFLDTLSGFRLDTLDSPAPFAANPWTINSYFTGPGVVAGTGANAGYDYFYPPVAGPGVHSVVYHYKDANGCISNASANITVTSTSGAGSSSIDGLQSKYCINSSSSTISVDAQRFTVYSCGGWLGICFGYLNFAGFEYFNSVSGTWVSIPSTFIPATQKFQATFNPSVIGAPANGGTGLRNVRAIYTGGTTLYLSDDVTINPLPTVTITNKANFGTYACQSFGDSLLVMSFGSGTTNITGFNTGTAGFIYFNTGNYYMKFSVASLYPGPTNTFSFNLQDVTSSCTNTVNFTQSVDATPSTPTPITPNPICAGSTVTISSNITSNSYVDWARKDDATTTIMSAGIYTPGATSSFSPPGVLFASDTFYIRQYSYSTCKSNWSPMVIAKVNQKAVIEAGTYSAMCSNGTILLNTSSVTYPAGATGSGVTWTRKTGSNGVFLPGNTTTSTIQFAQFDPGSADSTNAEVTLYIESADPDGTYGCSSVKDSVTINIKPAPRLILGSNFSRCSDQTVSLFASISGTASSVTWDKGGSTIGFSPNNTSQSVTYSPTVSEQNGPAATGTPLTFTATSNAVAPCAATSTNVTVTIYPEYKVNAGGGPNDRIVRCSNQTITLSGVVERGNVSTPAGILWTKDVVDGTIVANGSLTTDYTPTAAQIANGDTIVFTLTTPNPVDVCGSESDEVTVIINKRAEVSAGSDMTYCASDGSFTLDGTMIGATSSVQWSGNTLANYSSVFATDPIYTIVAEQNVTVPTNYTFTIKGNDPDGPTGPCLEETDDVVIRINPRLLVSAGSDLDLCAGTAVNLTGNVQLGGAGVGNNRNNAGANTWSVITGAGSVAGDVPSFNFNALYTPSGTLSPNVGELGNGGVITLRLTSSDPDGVGGPCPAVSDDIQVTLYQRARIFAGNDTSFCANDVISLNASYLTPTSNAIVWSGRPAAAFSSIYALTPIYTATPPEKLGGTYNTATGMKDPIQIQFTATTNDPLGPCPAESDDVIVSINPKLTVNAGTDYQVCGHTLMPDLLRTTHTTANIKLGDADRLTTSNVNSWTVATGMGSGVISGVDFSSNFHAKYRPSGALADSGTIQTALHLGSGELSTTSTITLVLTSNDPDGTGPCTLQRDSVNIKILPRPIPHFKNFAIEYCKNDGIIPLDGNIADQASEGALFTGTAVSSSGDFFTLNTSAANAVIPAGGEQFPIRYKQVDLVTNCNNYVDTTIRVFPFPTIYFFADSRCQFDNITFEDTSIINTSRFAGSVLYNMTDWVIDGVNTTNSKLAYATFANYGIHTFHLDVTSNSGGTINCHNSKDTTLVFAPYPKTSYVWSRPCSVDSVFFEDKTTIPLGYTNDIVWSMNGAGTFKRNKTISVTTADSLKPVYQYAAPGIYNVTLTAVTDIYGCTKDTTVEVFVVPTIDVTPSSPYATSFAAGNQNWVPSGQNYSWEHGTPVITPTPGIGGKREIESGRDVWITNLDGDYNLKEYSALNSPCFNFNTLDKPMMTLNLWTNTRNLAGAVLEATVGNSQPWVTIGQIGEGKNWYDTQGIVGLIGKSGSNPIAQGFSGEDTLGFDLSRIGLSQYATEDSLVRFRITFGSSDVDDDLNKRDGIAFDSIWIGNRSKVVLVEHFTNSLSTPSIVANDSLNSFQAKRSGDMVSIHYHTSFPGTDNMNLKNPADPSARVLYYGVSGVPRTQLDGIEQFEEYGNTPDAIRLTDIDNKALENAKFTLDVSSKKTENTIDIKTQMVAKEILAQDVVLQVAVLERHISGTNVGGNQTGYSWVLKKMIPDAAGSYINRTWAIGDTLKMPFTWTFEDGYFYDTANTNIEVVAFVQNKATKEVYQAARVGSSGATSTTPIITAVDVQDIEENLLIYPVPADNEINVLFGRDLIYDAPYTLSDDLGRVVEKGTIDKGVRMMSFNSKKLAAGMYYLSIAKEDGSKLNRKIVVVH